jgi:hypothetical protein
LQSSAATLGLHDFYYLNFGVETGNSLCGIWTPASKHAIISAVLNTRIIDDFWLESDVKVATKRFEVLMLSAQVADADFAVASAGTFIKVRTHNSLSKCHSSCFIR